MAAQKLRQMSVVGNKFLRERMKLAWRYPKDSITSATPGRGMFEFCACSLHLDRGHANHPILAHRKGTWS